MKSKKPQTYLILITETELCGWGESLAWKLPRTPISKAIALKNPLALYKDVCVDEIGDRKEDWLLAEFAPPRPRPRKGADIPFYCVVEIHGFDERQTAVLKSRFGENGYGVDVAGMTLCDSFAKWWNDSASARLRRDIESGIEAFPEMFAAGKAGSGTISTEEIVSAALRFGLGTDESDFLSHLFSYSREGVFPCDGLCAALCDLGKVLRKRQKNEEDTKRVSALSALVSDKIKKSQCASIAEVAEVLEHFRPQREYGIEFVLFLAWKYAAETKSGNIDYALVEHDVADAAAALVPAEKIADALRMFGGLSGFKAFAEAYHRKMRSVVK